MSFRRVFPLLSIAAMNYFYVWAVLYSTRPISHRVSHKEGKEEGGGAGTKRARENKKDVNPKNNQAFPSRNMTAGTVCRILQRGKRVIGATPPPNTLNGKAAEETPLGVTLV